MPTGKVIAITELYKAIKDGKDVQQIINYIKTKEGAILAGRALCEAGFGTLGAAAGTEGGPVVMALTGLLASEAAAPGCKILSAPKARHSDLEPDSRISSRPAVANTAQTGRTHERNRPRSSNVKNVLAFQGPSTHEEG
jgi:hypothetical protein